MQWITDTTLARMLVEFDQAPLYNATNFGFEPTGDAGRLANHTAMLCDVDTFVCPSDGRPPVAGYGRVSYRFSIGPTPWITALPLDPSTVSGPFTAHDFYRPADFGDGLSQTIGASERLQGGWIEGVVADGDYLLAALDFMDPLRRPGADGAVRACSGVPSTSPVERQGGESWFVSGLHYTNYNHCATPNASAKDCTLDWLEADFHNRTLRSGVFAARSRHPGGVNVLSMDGAVRFAGDSIDKATWRALATRSGGEVASSAF